MSDKPLLSILMITYNHENFIVKAIESFLMQKTDFPIEIIIGEDHSTDRTRIICREYQEKYPEMIRLISREKNLGIMLNFTETLRSCNGKYIALCEGDDYWTDSLKLQKQVDFLESNPDFAISFHKVEVRYEDDDTKSFISNPDQKEITTFEDLALGNYIHTLSCIFRNNLFVEFPQEFMDLAVGDYPLHLLNAFHGKIKFFHDVMGVYRIHSGGIWSMQNTTKNYLGYINTVDSCKNYFYPLGIKQFTKHMNKYKSNFCFKGFQNGNYIEFRNYYKKYILDIARENIRMSINLSIRYLLSFSSFLSTLFLKFNKK